MSKKNFRGGLDSLIRPGEPEQKAPAKGGPRGTDVLIPAPETKESLKTATFKFKPSHLKKLKAIAYWDDRLLQDLVAEALENYFSAYEKEHGEIKTR